MYAASVPRHDPMTDESDEVLLSSESTLDQVVVTTPASEVRQLLGEYPSSAFAGTTTASSFAHRPSRILRQWFNDLKRRASQVVAATSSMSGTNSPGGFVDPDDDFFLVPSTDSGGSDERDLDVDDLLDVSLMVDIHSDPMVELMLENRIAKLETDLQAAEYEYERRIENLQKELHHQAYNHEKVKADYQCRIKELEKQLFTSNQQLQGHKASPPCEETHVSTDRIKELETQAAALHHEKERSVKLLAQVAALEKEKSLYKDQETQVSFLQHEISRVRKEEATLSTALKGEQDHTRELEEQISLLQVQLLKTEDLKVAFVAERDRAEDLQKKIDGICQERELADRTLQKERDHVKELQGEVASLRQDHLHSKDFLISYSRAQAQSDSERGRNKELEVEVASLKKELAMKVRDSQVEQDRVKSLEAQLSASREHAQESVRKIAVEITGVKAQSEILEALLRQERVRSNDLQTQLDSLKGLEAQLSELLWLSGKDKELRKELEDQIESLQSELAESEEQLSHLQEFRIKEQEAHALSLKNEQARIDEMKVRIEEEIRRSENLEENVALSNEAVKSLETQLDALKNMREDQSSALEKAMIRAQDLETQLLSLGEDHKVALDQERLRANGFEMKIVELKGKHETRVKELEVRCESMKKMHFLSVQERELRCKDLEIEIDKLKEQLGVMTEEMKSRTVELKNRIEILKAEIESLKAENSRIVDLERSVLSLQAQNKSLESLIGYSNNEPETTPQSRVQEAVTKLSMDDIVRYSRQLLLQDGFGVTGQCKLLSSSVLVVGAGGIASTLVLYLAASGVGHFSVADFDDVDMSNLHRQVIHRDCNVGLNKAVSACRAALALNPTVRCSPIQEPLTFDNALAIVSRHDVVVDASDNPRTRYLVNDACVFARKPLISGSAMGTEGQLTVYNYDNGPCFRCLYPNQSASEGCKSCSDNGVLGPVPGLIGILQAVEVIKLLTGIGKPMNDRLLMYDSLRCSFVNVKKPPKSGNCPICGEKPQILTMKDSKSFSVGARGPAGVNVDGSIQNSPNELPALSKALEISCTDYNEIRRGGVEHVLLDVRVKEQFAMCSLEGSTNIPLAELESQIDRVEELSGGVKPVFCLCRRGIASAYATHKIDEATKKRGLRIHAVRNITGGLAAWSAEVDPYFPKY